MYLVLSSESSICSVGTLQTDFAQQVSTALIYGGIYSLSDSQSGIQDRLGLISLMAIGNTNLAIASTIRAFPKEKSIVMSDR